MGEPESPLVEFLEVMRRLRAECAWKAAQTHRSLQRYLLEEAHEVLEAIDRGEAAGDWDPLREELGDLLLQVYFHAVLAEERGEFTLDDVARDVVAKMRHRNPHVFGDLDGSSMTATEVNETWEAAKAGEKQRSSVLDGIAPTLPALLLADKVLDRLARAGVAPAVPERAARGVPERPHGSSSTAMPVPQHPDEVASPSPDQAESPAVGLGDRLLALVAEARDAGVDPAQALRDAVRRVVEAAERP
jgi:XTP/dITP diphosphohydrolase